MKLTPSYLSSQQYQDQRVKAVDDATATTIIGLCIGSAFFIILVAAATCFFYKRRNSGGEHHTTLLVKRSYPHEKPLTLRRPTAVKSPGTGSGGGIVLKKSPSPTGQKTPPGNGDKQQERRSSNGSDETQPSPSESAKISNLEQQQDLKGLKEVPKVAENGNYENEAKLQSNACDTSLGPEESEKDQEKEVGEEKSPRLGKLFFRLKYNYEKHALCVTIVKCSDLPPKETAAGSSDPYVKLQLLPEKQHKVKTRVLRKTLNPVYDEDFTFYGINPNQLEATTLHFVILSFDRYSRDDIIGEVIFQLGHLEFDTLEKQISMVREISPRSLKIRNQGRGEVLVSLCYQPAANRLTVVVLKARNLPKMDVTGLSDPFVKIYLLYNNQRIAKKKTHVKKRTTNPVFNESFVFDVPYNDGLDNLSLEFLLLDYDRVTKNEVIGKLELGPRAEGTAQKHWQEVGASPRRQIAEWHKLKE